MEELVLEELDDVGLELVLLEELTEELVELELDDVELELEVVVVVALNDCPL